jgi:hypothetical protein
LTLGEVSKISVYALPLFAYELSNAQCYEFAPLLLARRTTRPLEAGLPSKRRKLTDSSKKKALPGFLGYWRTRGNEPLQDIRPLVFRVSLETSISNAHLKEYTTGANGTSKIAVQLPLIVAKCGIVIKNKGHSHRVLG